MLDVVNLRVMGDVHAPSEGSIARQFAALAELQRQGLIRHLGVSNVTAAQVAEARAVAPVVCVQNQYNLAHRDDDALVDDLEGEGIAIVPFFPLGGFSPLQSSALSSVAGSAGRDANAGGARLAATPRAQHPADPGNVVTRSPAREPGISRAGTAGRDARRAEWHWGDRFALGLGMPGVMFLVRNMTLGFARHSRDCPPEILRQPGLTPPPPPTPPPPRQVATRKRDPVFGYIRPAE